MNNAIFMLTFANPVYLVRGCIATATYTPVPCFIWNVLIKKYKVRFISFFEQKRYKSVY